MAKSLDACAHALSFSCLSTVGPVASDAAPRSDPQTPRSICLQQDEIASLARQVADDVDKISEVHRAFACLESFVAPYRVGDSEEVCTTRSELSALLRLLNDELQCRVEAAGASLRCLSEASPEGDPQRLPRAGDSTAP